MAKPHKFIFQKNIDFNEDKHQYHVEGVRLSKFTISKIAGMADPSGGLMRWACKLAAESAMVGLPKDNEKLQTLSEPEMIDYFSREADRQRDNAASLGTRIHACLEKHIIHRINDSSKVIRLHDLPILKKSDKDISAAVISAQAYIDQEYEPVASEIRVVHPSGIPGTADFIGLSRSEFMPGYHLVDFKTVSDASFGRLYKKHFVQLAAYRYALESYSPTNKFSGCCIVQIHRETGDIKEFFLANTDEEHDLFMKLVEIAEYKKQKSIKSFAWGIGGQVLSDTND
jgi:hypothetical protein